LRVKTKRGLTFPSPVGVGCGLLVDGSGVDAILGATGIDSNSELSTFIELGTVTPEKQGARTGHQRTNLEVDFERETVQRRNR